VVGASARIEALAKAAKRVGHPDRVDHLRAELYLGMLDGSYRELDDAAILELLLADVATTGEQEACDGQEAAAAGEPADGAARPERGALGAGLELWVRASTLLGRDRCPGELAGWGPVHAELAGKLAVAMRGAQWRFVITDEAGAPTHSALLRARPHGGTAPRAAGTVELQIPAALLAELTENPPDGWAGVVAELSGHLADAEPAAESAAEADADADRRLPGAALRRYLRIRDRHCVGPGCRAPARSADIDHTHEHALGGSTVEANLAHACRHDHRIKHDGGWRLHQPKPGRFVWESRLGHTYPIEAPPIIEDLPKPAPADRPVPNPPSVGETRRADEPILAPPRSEPEPPDLPPNIGEDPPPF
jgi:hypothetical protein